MKNIQSFGEFLNEASSSQAKGAYDEVITLDSSDMEVFFSMLSDYFKKNEDEFTNMDAKKIASHLSAAHDLIKRRSGN